MKRYISVLVCADYINILGGSIYTTTRKTEALVIANKETGLEINAYKNKYMVMYMYSYMSNVKCMVISREQHA